MNTFPSIYAGLRLIGIFNKMPRIVTRFAFFALLILPVCSLAQDTLPPIIHYDMRDGLSQMKTNSIIQDKLGYIWIGTRNGLNRFDGEEIFSYTTADGLPHDRIHDIATDTSGKLLVLTYKGLSVFDGKTFRTYPGDFLNAEYRLQSDSKGRAWILTHDETSIFTGDTILRYRKPIIERVVLDSKNGHTYLVAQNGIFTYSDGQFLQWTEGNFGFDNNHFSSNDPSLLFSKLPGKKGLFPCVVKNGQLNCYEDTSAIFNERPGVVLYTQRRDGSFSIQTVNQTLHFDPSPFIRIVDIFMDEKGNFWVADENGFSVIQNSPFRHFDIRTLPYVWSVNQDRNGHYWAASFGYGLNYSENGHVFVRIRDAETVAGSPHFLATSDRGDDGTLYFGHSNGVLAYDGQIFTNMLARQPVYALVNDPGSSDLFIAGITGVHRISANGKVLISLTIENGLHDNEYIQNLSVDRDGNIWAGSYTGVSRIAPDLRTCENFTHENGRLPCEGVFCSYSGENGIVWLGGDHGLLWYDGKTDNIRTVQSHVLNSMVKSITRFDQDHLLIGAKNGLYVFNDRRFLEEGNVDLSVLNNSNGYQGLEPGFTGFYTDNREAIWICSASSVDVFENHSSGAIRAGLKTVITAINGQRLPFLGDPEILALEKGQSTARITVDAAGTVRPVEVAFQYRLDGKEWSPWIKDRQIVLNDLEHGDHVIEVRNGPTDLPPQLTENALAAFYVDLPFYKRSAFPLIAFLSVIGMLIIALIMYVGQRRENRRYIQQLAASKFLRSQLLLSELNPHFIFNILSSIQHKVLLGDREEAAGYVVKLSKMIRNFLTASHQSHRNLENYRENDIPLEKELELLKSYLEFEQMKSDGHFEYSVTLAQDIISTQVFIPPMLIQPFVENAIKHGLLLSSENGRVSVDISYFNEDLVIVIEDTGVGRTRAAELKGSREGHVSLGTMIIDQRIELLNQLGYRLKVETSDVIPTGTRVTITLKEE